MFIVIVKSKGVENYKNYLLFILLLLILLYYDYIYFIIIIVFVIDWTLLILLLLLCFAYACNWTELKYELKCRAYQKYCCKVLSLITGHKLQNRAELVVWFRKQTVVCQKVVTHREHVKNEAPMVGLSVLLKLFLVYRTTTLVFPTPTADNSILNFGKHHLK